MICSIGKEDYSKLIEIWVSAVKATHDFLKEEDFDFYREHLPIHFNHISLFAYKDEAGEIKGFLGVIDDSIEMLFIDNESRGSGIGKILMDYAINELDARRVDVNEQNKQALDFYYHLGFKEIGRSEFDGEGKNYPIISLQKF